MICVPAPTKPPASTVLPCIASTGASHKDELNMTPAASAKAEVPVGM